MSHIFIQRSQDGASEKYFRVLEALKKEKETPSPPQSTCDKQEELQHTSSA